MFKYKMLNVMWLFIIFSFVNEKNIEAKKSDNSVTLAVSGGTNFIYYLDPTMQGLRFSPHTNIYDPIVRYNPEAKEWQPMLAESWETIKPGQIRFKLKKGVKYHNGSSFTSHDVKFHLDRIKDDQVASPARGWYRAINKIEIVDDHTIDVFGKAYGILPTMNILTPVDKETFQRVGAENYNLNPVGTGPFVFEKWEVDNFITLKRNGNYWGGAPKISKVTFRFVSERLTKIAMLKSGEADIIDELPPDFVSELDKDTSVDVRTVPSHRSNFVTINTFRKPFNDVRVRKAMAYAVDWDTIIKELYAGRGYKQAAITPKSVEYYNDTIKPYSYNPQKAKKLLSEAGYPNGFTVDDPFKTSVGWLPIDNIASEAVVAYLADVGIKMELWSAEQASYWDKWLNKDITLGWLSCGNQTFAADFCYNAHFHPNFRGFYYNHPKLTKLLDEFAGTADKSKQKRLMSKIQNYVHDEVPYILGFVGDFMYGVSPSLNWDPSGDERIYLHHASWDN